MSRAPRLRRAAVALSLLVATLGPVTLVPGVADAAPTRSRTADTSEDTPLFVELTAMTPATVPAKGAIVLRGVVTNASTEDWTDINVAPFVSSQPMTTRDELAEAADADPAATVGNRLSDPGTYQNIGDLLPGASRAFELRVPRDSMGITGEPGVYWIGVHALGTNSAGRDLVADGRARSFIPLVAPHQSRNSVDVSLVLPMRERARRASDGSLAGPARWAELTAPNGRLARLAQFAASAGASPVTWEVDPAVLDALDDYSRGNPPLSLGGPQRVPQPQGSASPSPTPGSASASPDADSWGSGAGQGGHPDQQERQQAAAVLDGFVGAVRTQTLLTMPYADPDVAALVRNRAGLLPRAQSLAATRMQARGLSGTSTVAPPDALFDPTLLGGVPADTLMVLGDDSRLDTQPYGRLPSGQPLVLSDDRTSSGGPYPAGATLPLAMRQRILAEAALDADQRPIVVRFPMRWDPGAFWRDADFFAALNRPWLHLVPLQTGGPTTYDGKLAYGRLERAAEVGPANIAATRTLAHTGDVLGNLLANANDVRDRLTGAALQGSAYSARPSPNLAAGQVRALDTSVRGRMNRVQVTGTDFVTLSGGTGTLTVTLVNGLRQPVDVGLLTRTHSPDVHVESAAPVELGPEQRTTLRLAVRSSNGLHEVSMYPVTDKQQVVGTPLTFSVRTSQVGVLIWYVIGAAGVLLFVMILRRIVLRVRRRHWRLEDAS